MMNKAEKKLLNVKSTTPKLSDSWKLANLNLVFWRKWEEVIERQLRFLNMKQTNELEMDF